MSFTTSPIFLFALFPVLPLFFLSLSSVNADNCNFNTTDNTLNVSSASLLQLINHFSVFDAVFQILLIKSLRQNLCAFLESIIIVASSGIFCKKKKYLNYMHVHNLELNVLSYLYNLVLLEGFCFSAIVV